jgi:flagellar basal body-associated protein FliL
MIIHASDKKKQRLIIISTVVGMLLIVCVWAFQIHSMFTKTLAKETRESDEQMNQIVEDLEGFQDEIEGQMPFISESFDNLTSYFKQEYQAQIDAQKEQEQIYNEAQDDAASMIAQEAVKRLNSQTQEEEIIE